MKEISLRLTLPLAIALAIILFVYHPGKPIEKHCELRDMGEHAVVFDTTTGYVYVLMTKGSADKTAAQTRLGETKKSFTKARNENPRCKAFFLPSVLTSAVEKQLKTQRAVDHVFDLLAIFKDKTTRIEFLEELFKFCLREKI